MNMGRMVMSINIPTIIRQANHENGEKGAFEIVIVLLCTWFESFAMPSCLLVCLFGAKYAFI